MHNNNLHNKYFSGDRKFIRIANGPHRVSQHKITLAKKEEKFPDTGHNKTHFLQIPHIEKPNFESRFKVIEEEKTPKIEKKPEPEIKINTKTEKLDQNKIKRDIPKKAKDVKKSPKKKSGIYSKIKEFGILSSLAAVILVVLTIAFNPGAFAQYAQKYINPEKMEETKLALEQSVQETETKIVRPKFLPVAGATLENIDKFPTLNLSISPLENRIIIPKIGKNIPIVEVPKDSLVEENWSQLEKDIQAGLEEGVVHYPGTAVPGQNGNFFVTGHSSYYPWADGNYKDVFALLHDLEVGDDFFVYWNQKKYHYQIVETKVVSPSDTSVLDQPEDKNIVTLMTCTPVGTALNRLILVAQEI